MHLDIMTRVKSICQSCKGSIGKQGFSFPRQELPQLVEGGEQEAAAEEPLEDEFDLADVLGEEVGGSGSKEELLKKVEQELEVPLSPIALPNLGLDQALAGSCMQPAGHEYMAWV